MKKTTKKAISTKNTHPKKRPIPQMVINSVLYKKLVRLFKGIERLEEKVIFGVHLFELLMILLVGVVITATFALSLPDSTTSTIKTNTTIENQTTNTAPTVNEVSLPPKK